MKTFRKIGMALFAVLMSMNFASCDKDGDSIKNPSNEKKLMRMSMFYKGADDVYEFKYDQNGNVIEIREDYHHTYDGVIERGIDTYKFNWTSKNHISVTLNDEKQEASFTLADSKISKMTIYNHEGRDKDEFFSYDEEGRIKEYKDIWNDITTYTWDNDKLSQFNKNYIRYSNNTCKGFYPLFCDNIGIFDYLFIAHPELVGAKTTSLPIEISSEYLMRTFSYEFDADGYIESCTIGESYAYGGKWELERSIVYEFVWE